MKILLIQSYNAGDAPPVFPIGLACIKSYLAHHDVRAFDTNTSKNPFEDVKSILLDFQPQVVGISLRNIDSTNKRKVVFYYPYLKDLLDQVKSYSGARVVVGGSGFSMFAAQIMANEPRIDYGVFLEGESAFRALIENLDSPENVPSIYYRRNGEILFTKAAPPQEFNPFSMPEWRILPLSPYKARDSLGVETKRGCALGCIYCVYGFLNGKAYRLKEPVIVVDEIEYLVTQCGAERLMFLDSVFNFPKAHAEAVCREILRRGVKVKWSAWFGEANLTKEFLDLVSEAGCDSVMLSPDALSGHTLKTLGKDVGLKTVLEVYRLLTRSNRFDVSYNFFKNPPGQSWGNFFAIILFCLIAKWQLGRKVHFEFNSLRIEPHTRLCEIALKEGVVSKGENLLFPRYYNNRRTRFLGALFDTLLVLMGK